MKKVAVVISTTFGTGYFPIAPGTVGAAVAALVFWFVPELSWLTLALLSIAFGFVGIWATDVTAKAWNLKDPGKINWDEVVGQMITLIALPKILWVWVVAFFVFRVFDVWKPVPVRTVERLPGGWGIMLDDVLGGVYANIVMQLLVLFFVVY